MAGGAGKQFVWNTQQKLTKMRMTAALVLQYASLGGGARERVLPYLRRLVGAGETEQYEKIIERATALFDAMAEPKTGKPAHAAPTPAEWARLAALWHSAPRGGEARDAWIAQARSILDDMSRARGGAARLPFHARALLPNEVLQPGAEGGAAAAHMRPHALARLRAWRARVHAVAKRGVLYHGHSTLRDVRAEALWTRALAAGHAWEASARLRPWLRRARAGAPCGCAPRRAASGATRCCWTPATATASRS